MPDQTRKVSPVDPTKRTSAINSHALAASEPSVVCYWNGNPYSVGATVCDNGSLLRCEPDGTWSAVGTC
jgi:Protein of unknown function (DUF1496)